MGLLAYGSFQNIHDILKMIIKSLAGNMAFFDQGLYGNLVDVFSADHFYKGLSNDAFHISRHKYVLPYL